MSLITPNMGLNVWNLPTDLFSHDDLALNFARLDYHDHSPGRGVPIPAEGLADGTISAIHFADDATLKAVGLIRAYQNAAQSVATGATVLFDTVSWNYDAWWASGVFTPEIAGYYRVSGQVRQAEALGAVDRYWRSAIRRNGSGTFSYGSTAIAHTNVAAGLTSIFNDVVLLDGVDDTVEIIIEHNAGTDIDLAVGNAPNQTYIDIELIGRS